MKFIGKALLWIIVLAAVGYGAWYAYSKWWGTDNTKQVGSFVDTTAKNIGNVATNKANEIETNVASSAIKSASSFVGSTIGNLLSGLGGSIENVGVGLGGTPSSPADTGMNSQPVIITSGPAPAPTSSAFYVPPPPATIMVKVSASLNFSINSGKSYYVDWGDGKTAEGATATNEVTIVDHAWSTQGDYTIRMTIGENGSQSTSSFPVRVYQ